MSNAELLASNELKFDEEVVLAALFSIYFTKHMKI